MPLDWEAEGHFIKTMVVEFVHKTNASHRIKVQADSPEEAADWFKRTYPVEWHEYFYKNSLELKKE